MKKKLLHLRPPCLEHSEAHQVYIKFIKTQMGTFLKGKMKSFSPEKHVGKDEKVNRKTFFCKNYD